MKEWGKSKAVFAIKGASQIAKKVVKGHKNDDDKDTIEIPGGACSSALRSIAASLAQTAVKKANDIVIRHVADAAASMPCMQNYLHQITVRATTQNAEYNHRRRQIGRAVEAMIFRYGLDAALPVLEQQIIGSGPVWDGKLRHSYQNEFKVLGDPSEHGLYRVAVKKQIEIQRHRKDENLRDTVNPIKWHVGALNTGKDIAGVLLRMINPLDDTIRVDAGLPAHPSEADSSCFPGSNPATPARLSDDVIARKRDRVLRRLDAYVRHELRETFESDLVQKNMAAATQFIQKHTIDKKIKAWREEPMKRNVNRRLVFKLKK